MDLNEPDPHTGYPMGSYRQDPTGRYEPLWIEEDDLSLIMGQGIWAGLAVIAIVLSGLGYLFLR